MKKFILFVLVLVAIAAAIAYFNDRQELEKKRVFQMGQAQIQRTPANASVIAIDMNNLGHIARNELFNGDVPLLVVMPNTTNSDGKPVASNGINALFYLISYSDGRIDASNPLFYLLELAYLGKDNTIRFVPLLQLGIRAIVIDSFELEQSLANGVANEPVEVGTVVMTDNTRRLIALVPCSIDDMSLIQGQLQKQAQQLSNSTRSK